MNPSAFFQSFLAKGFHQVDSIHDNHPDLAGTSSSVSSRAFLDSHPDFGGAWQSVLLEANRYAKQHWEDYVNYEMAQSKSPEAVVRATARPGYIPDEIFAPVGIQLLTGTKQFLVDQKKIREDFSLEEWLYRPNRPKQG